MAAMRVGWNGGRGKDEFAQKHGTDWQSDRKSLCLGKCWSLSRMTGKLMTRSWLLDRQVDRYIVLWQQQLLLSSWIICRVKIAFYSLTALAGLVSLEINTRNRECYYILSIQQTKCKNSSSFFQRGFCAGLLLSRDQYGVSALHSPP